MLKADIELATQSDLSVLILGETGTGKSTLARQIHFNSKRKDKPFIEVNLASLHEGTLESALFGHERGAFTGADQKKIGFFEQAQGGTLFLDEIGELPIHLQVRLLEFLQTKKVCALGSRHHKQIDVRIICASNQPLRSADFQQRFRLDLLFRIQQICLELEPLRNSLENFDEIFHSTLKKVSEKHKKSIYKVDESFIKKIETYTWPGNWREFLSVMEYGVLQSKDGLLSFECLPRWFLFEWENLQKQITFQNQQVRYNSISQVHFIEMPLVFDYRKTMREFEVLFLNYALQKNRWKLSRAARDLKIPKTTLFRKLKNLNITH